jgi:hypothetical protein
MANFLKREASDLAPIGTIVVGSTTALPDGYLRPVGQELSRIYYPELNAAYANEGYPHGAGDGTTTFNVPNYSSDPSLMLKARPSIIQLEHSIKLDDIFATYPNITGNAATATALETAHTIGGVSFDGSADINLPGVNAIGNQDTTGNAATATIAASCSGNAATATATVNTLTRGSYLTGSNFNGSAATTWAVDATAVNTVSKVVARDASGNFAAGTIYAALSGNATTASNGVHSSGNDWIRFHNGTQICWGVSGLISTTSGGSPAFYGASTVAFPVAFTGDIMIALSSPDNNSSGIVWPGFGVIGTTTITVYLVAPGSSYSGKVGYIAAGRWL